MSIWWGISEGKFDFKGSPQILAGVSYIHVYFVYVYDYIYDTITQDIYCVYVKIFLSHIP